MPGLRRARAWRRMTKGISADYADCTDFLPGPAEPLNPRTRPLCHPARSGACPARFYGGAATRSRRGALRTPEEASRLQPHYQTGAAEAKSEARMQSIEARSAESETADCGLVTAAEVGTPSLTPQVAVEVAAEVPLQIHLRIAPQIGIGIAIRIGWEVGSAITAIIRPQIAFRKGPRVALQIGRRIAGRIRPPTPAKVPPETTVGTVPGTVPNVTPEVSFRASAGGLNRKYFGYLGQFGLSCLSQMPVRARSDRLRLPKTANLGVRA